MLKLKSIELVGFKSFSERTRLEFIDGITAIVGPNGCGKSNLADAINWVLGEQSARILRGGRMTDVIFNGTRRLPPTGLAEVRLTLVDPDGTHLSGLIPGGARLKAARRKARKKGPSGNGHSPTAEADASDSPELFNDAPPSGPVSVMISRRLFRSGESDYLMNGEKCRLRDVQELFMGMGLGPDSYAIIEQGRIGQILSSKPADRRAILEEAAGVSKFKTRKRLAEAKLESSRANLSRIHDILEEVTRQVNSLRRQAGKARRFRALREEMSGRMKLVLVSRWMAIESDCRKLSLQIEGLQQKIVAESRTLKSREVEHKESRQQSDEMDDRLTALREEKNDLEIETERSTARLERCAQQLSDLAERSREATEEVDHLTSELESRGEAVRTKSDRLEESRVELEQARRQVIETQKIYTELASRIEQEEARSDSERQALLDAVGQGADLRNLCIRYEESRREVERRVEHLKGERDTLAGEVSRLRAEGERFSTGYRKSTVDLEAAVRAWQETRNELERVRQEELQQREALEKLKESLSITQARRKVLDDSLARHTYAPEHVHRLLSSELPRNGNRFRPLGVLADFVEVTPGYESLVEEYLREELDSVVVEEYEDARSGIQLLAEESRGRSAFFIRQVNGSENDFSSAISRQREEVLKMRKNGSVVAPLTELVRFEGTLESEAELVLNAVRSAFVVANPETAEDLALRYPTFHFLTPEGEHYHYRLVRGGSRTNQGPLALRRELRDLTREAEDLAPRTQAAEEAKEAASERLKELELQGERLLGERQEAEKQLFIAGQSQENSRKELGQGEQRLETVERELTRLLGEQEALKLQGQKAQSEWKSSQTAEQSIQQNVGTAVENLRRMRSDTDGMQADLLQAQSDEKTLEQRAHFLSAELEEISARHEDLNGRHQGLTSQIRQWGVQAAAIREEERNEKERLETLKSRRQSGAETLARLGHENDQLKTRLAELEPQIAEQRSQVDTLREQRSQLEVHLARLESEGVHPLKACQEEFGASPVELRESLETLLEGEELRAAEEEYRQMKGKLEEFGAVNMVALEELQEADERQTFLTSQERDLKSSIEDTALAIRELDQTSRQKFQEAFEAINRYFSETFKILFGGGLGEMRLSTEDDVDGGLDVVAQPPGKRLQNVLLLSGGEKALTALALLIAIFRYRPSPFCLLDEVDAPLDETNVGRFTRLIRQLSSRTQFILITHNKKTMETAEVLYGVTMEEPGVSRLTSVHLDRILPESAVPETMAKPAEVTSRSV